jgi:formylglycine-generating enzyme required for sulfatase activity
MSRGGSWNDYANYCRAAHRYYSGGIPPYAWGNDNLGFRTARSSVP